jgi:hypothetical protein
MHVGTETMAIVHTLILDSNLSAVGHFLCHGDIAKIPAQLAFAESKFMVVHGA